MAFVDMPLSLVKPAPETVPAEPLPTRNATEPEKPPKKETSANSRWTFVPANWLLVQSGVRQAKACLSSRA